MNDDDSHSLRAFYWWNMYVYIYVNMCECVFTRTHALAVRDSTVGRRNDSFVGE